MHRWQPGQPGQPDPTHVSPIEAQPALAGLAIPGTCSSAFFFSASTSSRRRALHPSRPSSTPSRNPPAGLAWGSLGSHHSPGLLGPPGACLGRLAKLCFWLSVQPALLGHHALRASGGHGPCKPKGRVQTPLHPPSNRATSRTPGLQPPQHETQPLFGDVVPGHGNVRIHFVACESGNGNDSE